MRKEGKGRKEKEKKKGRERERAEEERGGDGGGGVIVVSVGIMLGPRGSGCVRAKERGGLSAEPRWGGGGLHPQFCTSGCEQPPCKPGIHCLRWHEALGIQCI